MGRAIGVEFSVLDHSWVGQDHQTGVGRNRSEARRTGVCRTRSLVPCSLYRLQSDFVSAAAQEGVEPEPLFFALRNPFARVGGLRAAGKPRNLPRVPPRVFTRDSGPSG